MQAELMGTKCETGKRMEMGILCNLKLVTFKTHYICTIYSEQLVVMLSFKVPWPNDHSEKK